MSDTLGRSKLTRFDGQLNSVSTEKQKMAKVFVKIKLDTEKQSTIPKSYFELQSGQYPLRKKKMLNLLLIKLIFIYFASKD